MKNLIAFIESHGNKMVSHTDETITAECKCTKDGAVTVAEETFPATWEAARNWLGY